MESRQAYNRRLVLRLAWLIRVDFSRAIGVGNRAYRGLLAGAMHAISGWIPTGVASRNAQTYVKKRCLEAVSPLARTAHARSLGVVFGLSSAQKKG